jgi:hypothetical protein
MAQEQTQVKAPFRFATTVWVHEPNVSEANNKTGFVDVMDDVAVDLITRKLAQDPRVGAFSLKVINPVQPQTPQIPTKPIVAAKVVKTVAKTIAATKLADSVDSGSSSLD